MKRPPPEGRLSLLGNGLDQVTVTEAAELTEHHHQGVGSCCALPKPGALGKKSGTYLAQTHWRLPA